MVTEQGDVWACGKGEHGVLGLGTDAHQLLPALVGGADEVFDGEAVVLVAAGREHTACVSLKGTLWSWGNGEDGRLGHGDEESRQRPQRLHRDMHGGSPAVMVSCGNLHMLVLTTDGVWSCGFGGAGRLGHGDTASQLVLTLVGAEGFRGGQIVMVAAGVCHSVALGAQGSVWTWGEGSLGRLGHNNQENRLVPTLLAGEALGGAAAVLVAAGGMHTVVVTRQGALWVWGRGLYGQLGLGDEGNRLAPARVGSEESFGGSHVITAHCGLNHTLAITKDGALWTFGIGTDGALDHTGRNNRLVPTRIEAHHFGNAKIVCAAAGHSHSAAVTEHGILYTWGLAAGPRHPTLVPTCIAPHLLQGARVGRCHDLPLIHALAFAMGTHARLGSADETAPAHATDCAYLKMPGELVRQLVEACASRPEGQVVGMEGVVRLMGGGEVRGEV